MNTCEVCGSKQVIFSHYYIPYRYISNFSDNVIKTLEIIKICHSCHVAYEDKKVSKIKREICHKYGIIADEDINSDNFKFDRIKKLAHTLNKKENKIPEKARNRLIIEYEKLTGKKAIEENFKEDIKAKKNVKFDAELLAEKIIKEKKISEFQALWKEYFFKVMNLKFIKDNKNEIIHCDF